MFCMKRKIFGGGLVTGALGPDQFLNNWTNLQMQTDFSRSPHPMQELPSYREERWIFDGIFKM